MRKRGVYLMVLVLVVAGVLVAVFSGREREPEYGGKRLSEWVTKMGFMPGQTLLSREYLKAKNAVGQIGPNAVPFLIKWVSYEQPGWKIRLVRLTGRFGSRGFVDRQALRADGAKRALVQLGASGQCDIPELLSRAFPLPRDAALLLLLRDGHPDQAMVNAAGEQTAYRLAELFVGFGKPRVPALLAVLTNQQAPAACRLRAAQYVPGYTNYTPEALRALQELLKNPEVQAPASILLREIEAERLRGEAMAQGTK